MRVVIPCHLIHCFLNSNNYFVLHGIFLLFFPWNHELTFVNKSIAMTAEIPTKKVEIYFIASLFHRFNAFVS